MAEQPPPKEDTSAKAGEPPLKTDLVRLLVGVAGVLATLAIFLVPQLLAMKWYYAAAGTAGLAAVGPLWAYLLMSAEGRAHRAAWLRESGPEGHYRRALRGVLDAIDRRLSTQSREDREPARAWSYGALNLTLGLALAYPLLSLLLQWGYDGEAARLGGRFEVLPATPDWRPRAATIGGLAISIVSLIIALRLQGPLILRLAALAGAFAFAAAVAGAVAFAVASTLAGAVAFTLALAVTVAVGVAAAFAVAFEGAFAVAFASTLAGAVATEELGRRADRRAFALLGIVAIGLAALTAISAYGFAPTAGNDDAARTLLVFLGFLPLLNALFDFASLGLTRYYLRKEVEAAGAAALRFALWDALWALALFLGLKLTLIAVFAVLPAGNTGPLLPIGPFLRDVADAPEDYVWLGVTLFSTLIPTALHLALFTLSLTVRWPRLWLADLLDPALNAQDGAMLRPAEARQLRFVLAWAVLTACTVLPILLLVYAVSGLYGVVTDIAPIKILLGIAFWWADLLGVAVPPP